MDGSGCPEEEQIIVQRASSGYIPGQEMAVRS
jgi:hypothetical protein